jgi:hypothetical protein
VLLVGWKAIVIRDVVKEGLNVSLKVPDRLLLRGEEAKDMHVAVEAIE